MAILACVPASTSGLTRTEIRAVLPASTASRDSSSSSGSDLDVDAENVRSQRRAQLGFGLADAREQDLARRNAGRQRALQLAAGHHVGAGAELCQRAQHRLVGVRLHGVADQRLLAGEGLGEDPVVALQRRGRIAIERRADRIRQFGQIDRLGVQHAVAIVEVIHGALSRPAAGRERMLSCGLWARLAARFGPVGRIEHARLRRRSASVSAARRDACADGVRRQVEPALAAAAAERERGRAQAG